MRGKGLLTIIIVTLMALIISSCIRSKLVLVTAINVTGENQQEVIRIGETLQMVAQIQPKNASNKEVTWSVENAAGTSVRENIATITQEGIITGLSAGTVVVKATAKDGSEVEGTKSITFLPQTYSLTIEASPATGGNVSFDNITWSGSASATMNEGTEVEIYASAEEGHSFVNWTKDGVEISAQATYTCTMTSENLTLAANFVEEQPIHFECPAFEQAVRDAKGYTGEPTGPIYPSDVLGITRIHYRGSTSSRETDAHNLIPECEKGKRYHVPLNQETEDTEQNTVSRAKITSLEGIQYLTNLTELFFGENSVSDISPLQNLTNLTSLFFWNNSVNDISPLQNLTNLTQLSFGDNSVSDISPLQNLINLTSLVFGGNSVSDISPLQNLTNLTHLDFHDNSVSDISPVQNLINLTTLYFDHNSVSDISPVQNLTNLTSLYFYYNSVSDISPVQNLSHLIYLDFEGNSVSDISPVQNLSHLAFLRFWNNSVSDISPVQNMTNLEYLGFEHNSVSDISPVQNLTNLGGLDFGDNGVSDISHLQSLTSLTSLYFGNNSVSDISPLQNMTNLHTLYFEHNGVSDISPIQNMTNLSTLDFEGNSVSDISPLQNMTSLTSLYFGDNSVSDISPLQNMTALWVLRFSSNQVNDITPLQNLSNLMALNFSDNLVSDISSLVANSSNFDPPSWFVQFFGWGWDGIIMTYNNLDLTTGSQNMTDINTLIGRGANVEYEPQN